MKPAGTILVVDIRHTRQHRDGLLDPGAQEVSVPSLGPAGRFDEPFSAGKLVAARKPWLRLAAGSRRGATGLLDGDVRSSVESSVYSRLVAGTVAISHGT